MIQPILTSLLALTLDGTAAPFTPGLWVHPQQPADQVESQNDELSELRDRNRALQAQIEELDRERSAMRSRIDELEQRIAQLDRELAELRRPAAPARPPAAPPAPPPPQQTPPSDVERITVDETIPSASPRALLRALTESYQGTMADLDLGAPGDAQRRAYLRGLEGWKRSTERLMRTFISWQVRVVEMPATRQGAWKLVAVDPVTDVRLGDPFDVALPRLMAERLTSQASRGELGVLVLQGLLSPRITINAARETRGAFDNPPFIGPFAEFGMNIEVRRLAPASELPPAPS